MKKIRREWDNLVLVLINQDMHLTDGYYEIIGNVKEDKSVKALTSIELGPQLGE
jgi:hypothetical protein